MQRSGGKFKAARGALVLGLALVAQAASAQSVSDYRLPGATSTPDPKAQGPVDPDAPVVRRAIPPAAQPSAAPTITPSPVVTAVPPARSQPVPRPQATPAPSPRAAAAPISRPGLATGAPAAPVPTETAPGPSAETVPAPGFGMPSAPLNDTPTAAAPAQGTQGPGIWPWIAGAMAVLAGLFAALWWWRGRSAREVEVAFEPPVVRAKEPEPVKADPATAHAQTPAPASAPGPIPAPVFAQPNGLDIALVATRMSASLLATTLNYRLTVTNRGDQALSALAVEGDMVSAHSSLPPEQQMANGAHRLELRHALVSLAPGESAEFTGDFRLPLTSVTPIRAGEAAYFVPLARLRVEASTPSGGPLVSVQTFVVGELPENPGAALRPFRLDLGPRTYSRIGQRAVS
ncbi:hypothetical protein ACFFF7_02995 [Novosphingobium aquiterrae]|uniref:DUF3426 domain-containing protein n=2 Tax=Novosphingobium aquiterrae TaxID=624388 RepID=A0ABV6PEX4_9SPHN